MLQDTLVFAYSVRGDVAPIRAAYLDGQTFNMCDEDGQTALHLATQYRRYSVMDVLFNTVLPVNAQNRWNHTPLSIAVENCDVRAAKVIRAHRGELRGAFGRHKEPILHIAVRADLSDAADIVRWLLSEGGDPDVCNAAGATALQLAVSLNRPSAAVMCLYCLNRTVWTSTEEGEAMFRKHSLCGREKEGDVEGGLGHHHLFGPEYEGVLQEKGKEWLP